MVQKDLLLRLRESLVLWGLSEFRLLLIPYIRGYFYKLGCQFSSTNKDESWVSILQRFDKCPFLHFYFCKILIVTFVCLFFTRQTSTLIPLCHPLPLEKVHIDISLKGKQAIIECECHVTHKTGVEMEVR